MLGKCSTTGLPLASFYFILRQDLVKSPKLASNCDPPVSGSGVVEITGVHHPAQCALSLSLCFCLVCLSVCLSLLSLSLLWWNCQQLSDVAESGQVEVETDHKTTDSVLSLQGGVCARGARGATTESACSCHPPRQFLLLLSGCLGKRQWARTVTSACHAGSGGPSWQDLCEAPATASTETKGKEARAARAPCALLPTPFSHQLPMGRAWGQENPQAPQV